MVRIIGNLLIAKRDVVAELDAAAAGDREILDIFQILCFHSKFRPVVSSPHILARYVAVGVFGWLPQKAAEADSQRLECGLEYRSGRCVRGYVSHGERPSGGRCSNCRGAGPSRVA